MFWLAVFLVAWSQEGSATSVYACSMEITNDDCVGSGGGWGGAQPEESVVSGGWAVNVCRAGPRGLSGHSWTECEGAGGHFEFALPAHMTASDLAVQGDGVLASVGGFAFFSGGGGDGGSTEDWDVSMLDSSQLAAAWGAGFVLMAMAFVIGRSVSLLLEMIRRG